MKAGPRPTLQFLAAVGFFLVLVVGFSTSQPTLRTAGILLTALAFVLWAFSWTRARSRLLLPRCAVPIFGLVAWCLLLAWRSAVPLAGLERALTALALAVYFLILSEGLRKGWRPRALEDAILTFAGVFVVIEIILWGVWNVQWWTSSGEWLSRAPIGYRATGLLLGHPNVLAGYLCLALPLALRHALEPARFRIRLGWTILGALFLFGLYLTSSRSGWLAGAAGLSVMVILHFSDRLKHLPSSAGSLAWRAATVVGIALLVTAALALLFRQTLLTPGHASLSSPRANIWGPATQIIAESPLLGQGVGSFPVHFAVKTAIPPGFATSHAHNLGLQILAEIGVVGLCWGLWIGFEIVRSLRREWRELAPPDRLAVSAYIGALLAAAVHHLADFLLEATLYAAALLTILALALRFGGQGDRVSVGRPVARAGALLVLAIYLVGGALTLKGSQAYWQGVAHGRAGEWGQAAEELCWAAAAQPRITLYTFQCGLALANLGTPQNLDSAIAAYRRALELDPAWPVHWANLAAIEWAAGHGSEATANMRIASDAAPSNSFMALNLGLYLEAEADHAGAVAAYRRAIRADPWVTLRIGVEGSQAWQLALSEEAGFVTEYASQSPAFAAWAQWPSHREAARGGFLDAVRSEPLSAMAHAGLALAEQAAGDPIAATQQMRIAMLLGVFDPYVQHAAAQLSSLQGEEVLAQGRLLRANALLAEPNQSGIYYTTAYLRYYLASDLVPQVARADLTEALRADLTDLRDELTLQGDTSQALKVETTLDRQARLP